MKITIENGIIKGDKDFLRPFSEAIERFSVKSKEGGLFAGILPRLINAYPNLEIEKVVAKISCGLSEPIKMYPFQEEALKEWMKKGVGIIILPTGAGKTTIALHAIYRLRYATLILVPTRPLLLQWKKKIKEELGIVPAIWGDGKKEIGAITITTYNSCERVLRTAMRKHGDIFNLLIADEVHHIPARTLVRALLHCGAIYRMGLSATLHRSDKREHVATQLIGKVVYSKSYGELAEYFPKFEYFCVKVYLPNKQEYHSIDKKDRIKFLANHPVKLKAVAEILNERDINKAIIFVRYLKTVALMEKVLSHCCPLRKVAVITGGTRKKIRQQILRLFEIGQIDTIITTNVLDEGLDVPDVDCVIFTSRFKSKRQLIQRIGRGMRKGKKKLSVYDVVFKGTVEEEDMSIRVNEVVKSFVQRKIQHSPP